MLNHIIKAEFILAGENIKQKENQNQRTENLEETEIRLRSEQFAQA